MSKEFFEQLKKVDPKLPALHEHLQNALHAAGLHDFAITQLTLEPTFNGGPSCPNGTWTLVPIGGGQFKRVCVPNTP